ncbi:MAG TPA: DUF255 domain-containing protein [Gemmatimonadota bacterium]|nr:DUF255 domain-containing protein [Gemmatimonadota bacterium]
MPLDPHAAASAVHWLEWGPEAFARARDEDKPVLLRISAVWCHWCHVMDETTDSDPEVARRMNEWFVPVRVDNDERPDVNDRYNLGGWPTTAFLTPDGELITGGTYFPAPQFREVLARIHEGWTEHRDQVAGEVEAIRRRRRESRAPAAGGELDGEAIAAMVEAALDAYDWRHGGFGNQPKFPQPDAVRLLLHAHAGSGAEHPLEAAERTLVAMRTAGLDEGRNYGLYDHVAGGFFRYSTTRDWTVPHFEKMSEENARLSMAYLDAWRLTGDELHADTVRGIFAYVRATLSDPAGGAWGSQDADGEADYYGLDAAGRDGMPEPYVDRRIYTAWNGAMAAAAFEAAAALDLPELADWARKTVDRIEGRLVAPGGLVRHVLRPFAEGAEVDEEAPLLLSDQAWWLRALLAAYQSTREPAYRSRAETLAGAVERDLFDAGRGAFRDRAGGDAVGALVEPLHPLHDNAALAEGLAALAALGCGERWRERAGGALAALRGEAARHGILGATWGLAAAQVLAEPLAIHLVGSADDPGLRALYRAAWAAYLPGRVTEVLDPAADGERLAALGYPGEPMPRAYVCVGERCLEPAADPAELAERVEHARGEALA